VAFTQSRESFLGKLSIPVTEELLLAGELCARYLYAVFVSIYTGPPRTLIHHDVQGDNILVAGDGERSLALIDWQLTTAARPVIDLADFLVAHLDTSERRRHEDRLLEIYHSVLTERDVAEYPPGAVQGRLQDGSADTGQQPGHRSRPPSWPDRNAGRVLERRVPSLCPSADRSGCDRAPSAALRLVEELPKRP